MNTESFIQEALRRRPRRNRQSAAIRGLVQETHLHASQLVAPLFIVEGQGQQQAIASMPGIYRYSLDTLLQEVWELREFGIQAVDLFCYIPNERKDADGSEAIRPGNHLQQALHLLKKEFPDLCDGRYCLRSFHDSWT